MLPLKSGALTAYASPPPFNRSITAKFASAKSCSTRGMLSPPVSRRGRAHRGLASVSPTLR